MSISRCSTCSGVGATYSCIVITALDCHRVCANKLGRKRILEYSFKLCQAEI